MNLLIATSVTKNIEAANGTIYSMVTFRPFKGFVPGSEVAIRGSQSGNYPFNPGKEPAVGEILEGEITTLDTEDYEIDGRVVNKVTVTVIDGESAIDAANKLLEAKGHSAKVVAARKKANVTQ